MFRAGKMLRNKKGYVRTIEAAIAIILSFLFLTFAIPTHTHIITKKPDVDLLRIEQQNPSFRECTVNNNRTCLASIIQISYPDFYKSYYFTIQITEDPDSIVDLPEKEVFVDSVMIAGEGLEYNPRIVRLYSWIK
jgi:hypothetical protein